MLDPLCIDNDDGINISDLRGSIDNDDDVASNNGCDARCYWENIHRDWDPYLCDLQCYRTFRGTMKRYVLWLRWLMEDEHTTKSNSAANGGASGGGGV